MSNDLIKSVLESIAPSFDVVRNKLLKEGVDITPSQYIKHCKDNGLTPDIPNIFIMIDEGVATTDDVNLILCDVVDSVRERILRKTRVNPADKHISHGGRQGLGNHNMAGRVAVKKSRSNNTQSHGGSKHAHDRSTRKQRRRSGSIAHESIGNDTPIGSEPIGGEQIASNLNSAPTATRNKLT